MSLVNKKQVLTKMGFSPKTLSLMTESEISKLFKNFLVEFSSPEAAYFNRSISWMQSIYNFWARCRSLFKETLFGQDAALIMRNVTADTGWWDSTINKFDEIISYLNIFGSSNKFTSALQNIGKPTDYPSFKNYDPTNISLQLKSLRENHSVMPKSIMGPQMFDTTGTYINDNTENINEISGFHFFLKSLELFLQKKMDRFGFYIMMLIWFVTILCLSCYGQQ